MINWWGVDVVANRALVTIIIIITIILLLLFVEEEEDAFVYFELRSLPLVKIWLGYLAFWANCYW